jgi:hypothetical protein
VLEEALVLDCDDCPPDVARDALQRDDGSVLNPVEGPYDIPLGVEQLGRFWGPELQIAPLEGRKVGYLGTRG